MEKEVEQIRKFWIDPQTNRAWDIFADSSEAFVKAKRDIPALLSALEAAQREYKELAEGVAAQTLTQDERETALKEKLQASQRESAGMRAILKWLLFRIRKTELQNTWSWHPASSGDNRTIQEVIEQALARTEKEVGEISINLSAIRFSLQNFDKARWEYEQRHMNEEPIKKEALELQRCALELARLLVWTEKEGGG